MFLPEFTDIEQSLWESCDDFGSIEDVASVDDVFQPALSKEYSPMMDRLLLGTVLQKTMILKPKVPHLKTAPTLIVTAEMDDLARPLPVHDDISALCEQGYTIEHRQCADAGHVSGILDSLGNQWDWLRGPFE